MYNDKDSMDFLSNNRRYVMMANQTYEPVQQHWFYKERSENNKHIWRPFSKRDSRAIEEVYMSDKPDSEKIVPTDGSRFDVDISNRLRMPIYWKAEPAEVRRCSWFYRTSTSTKYLPYDEHIAINLEEEYKKSFEKNQWHKRIELPNKDVIVLHSYDVIVLFPPSLSPDDWSSSQSQIRPTVVRRGVEEFDIDEGEPEKVDHILFMVHGIGSVCDLKLRTVQEAVDDFRSVCLQLLKSHYQSSCTAGLVNRVEVLPISWHSKLHSEDTGVDERLKSITLESIPRLRDFTNDTLLDILFYTSPKYCQQIVTTVGDELNKLYELFKIRNPTFNGKVSLAGHSLGSLILFDLLSHQKTPDENVEEGSKSTVAKQNDRRISHMYGVMGSGFVRIHYPQLLFQPTALYAMGSPIGMFVTVRGLDSLGEDFSLPTCSAFLNIFHPYDPVAYRIESLVNPALASLKPMLIPHHKGRKRMHLELKETMARVGADLKQKVVDSVKHTWNSFFQLGIVSAPPDTLQEGEERTCSASMNKPEEIHSNLSFGILNKGRRIDYVLQESPFELFNEYVSSLTSHVCYWESEDTMLFILKEIYSTMDVKPDSQIPQATMTIERPVDSGSRRGSSINTSNSFSEECSSVNGKIS